MTRLADIHGQEQALDGLRRAIAVGKVPHAYLFVGPGGVGKTTTATAFAAALNCEDPRESSGCDRCASCAKIAAGTHPDVLWLRPSGAGHFIVIEDVRDLIARLGFPPHEGRARVVIVEEAHRLNPASTNAFLKTLEEPPARTHFVLVTDAPDQLLDTVRSRCQRVRFAPLSVEALGAILRTAGVEAAQAEQAAGLADGSATRAMALAEGDALERRRQIVQRIAAAGRTDGLEVAVTAANELAQEKEELAPTLELLARWYRDASALAAGTPLSKLINRDRADELRQEADRSDGPASAARRARAVLEAQTSLLGFANPQLTLERMILALREG